MGAAPLIPSPIPLPQTQSSWRGLFEFGRLRTLPALRRPCAPGSGSTGQHPSLPARGSRHAQQPAQFATCLQQRSPCAPAAPARSTRLQCHAHTLPTAFVLAAGCPALPATPRGAFPAACAEPRNAPTLGAGLGGCQYRQHLRVDVAVGRNDRRLAQPALVAGSRCHAAASFLND